MSKGVTSNRRVTIRDVAAHAGVSTASASLVLRKAPGVGAATRKRVEAAMEELDYHPLASARGMRGKTFTLGVMVSDIQNPFFSVLLDGIAETIAETGYEPLIGPGGATAASQSRMIQAMIDRQMDGLILIAPHPTEVELSRVARMIPIVVMGRHGPATTFDTVAGDDLLGSQLIVEHLRNLGHERISYVTHAGPDAGDDRRPEQVREQGYVDAMRANGLDEYIDVIRSEWSNEGGIRAAHEVVSRSVRPTAIHAGSDVAAFGLLGELWRSNLQVPSGMSLVGYDNTPTAALPSVGLTSVDQSGLEMGRKAAELLLERVEGRTDARHMLTEPWLAVRNSSQPLDSRAENLHSDIM